MVGVAHRNFHIISPAFPSGGALFGCFQCALNQPSGRLCLAPGSHTKIADWHNLVTDLGARLTHLLEVVPPDPTCHDTHDALSEACEAFPEGRSSTFASGVCA